MGVNIGNYEWHEFFPNGKVMLFTLLFKRKPRANFAYTFSVTSYITISYHLSFYVGTRNIGVVIAIWTPVVMVSGLNYISQHLFLL